MSRNHDFIRDGEEGRKEKGKGNSHWVWGFWESGFWESRVFPSSPNAGTWNYEKTRIIWNCLFPTHIFCHSISYFNELLGKTEFSISLFQILWPPLPHPQWVCTVNEAGFHQEHQGILLRPQGAGVPEQPSPLYHVWDPGFIGHRHPGQLLSTPESGPAPLAPRLRMSPGEAALPAWECWCSFSADPEGFSTFFSHRKQLLSTLL